MAPLCDIYGAGVNGCGVHDGLMQYDTLFEIFQRISFLVDIRLRWSRGSMLAFSLRVQTRPEPSDF